MKVRTVERDGLVIRCAACGGSGRVRRRHVKPKWGYSEIIAARIAQGICCGCGGRGVTSLPTPKPKAHGIGRLWKWL